MEIVQLIDSATGVLPNLHAGLETMFVGFSLAVKTKPPGSAVLASAGQALISL